MMRPMSSGPHQLTAPTPEGNLKVTARPSRPRLGHMDLIPDREALRASAHSHAGCQPIPYLIIYR